MQEGGGDLCGHGRGNAETRERRVGLFPAHFLADPTKLYIADNKSA